MRVGNLVMTTVLKCSDTPTTLEATQGQILSQSHHRCCLREVAFEWELTEETIYSPLGGRRGGLAKSEV